LSDNPAFSYIDENTLPYHFCPGCGHGAILDCLNSTLDVLQIDPLRLVIVTDIGCSGLSDKYFKTNAFHGLHGRSVTYATGIKLANPSLNVIVLMGDGGCGIGGNHLVSAARRNIGITVLVFNNFNYGMTGGQHSVSTPLGAITSSTKYGNIEYPMDICTTVVANGASFVARSTTFDNGLSNLILEALKNPGFSLVDIWELCTAYYAPKNELNKQMLEDLLDSLNFRRGIICQQERTEFSEAYRKSVSELRGLSPFERPLLDSIFKSNVTQNICCLIAGDAGMRIGTAAAAFSRGAILSGLWATQRNDYPVTVRYGYSISEVILSPDEFPSSGISHPNIMVVLFSAGLEEVREKLLDLNKEDILFINTELLPVETKAQVVSLDFRKTGFKRDYWALMAIAVIVDKLKIFPLEALRTAIDNKSLFSRKAITAINNSSMIIVDHLGEHQSK
jgi:pyruvate/2-oxoacid:ferredoxin oxidoreductase beta subunit/Pyruvate/2-oxoacid:ferredoxin oxidoreductase gamma subunit